MRGPKPPEVKLTPMLNKILEKIARCYTNPYWLVLRAKIVLYAAVGANNTEIARRVDTTADTAGKRRGRWIETKSHLSAAEAKGLNEKELAALAEAALSDAPRPGTPDTFTPEQLVQVIAVACEDPRESDRPACAGHADREISHWTHRELADEVIQRKIVDTISPRHVGRVLDELDMQPHLSRYWPNNERSCTRIFRSEPRPKGRPIL